MLTELARHPFYLMVVLAEFSYLVGVLVGMLLRRPVPLPEPTSERWTLG